MSDKNEIRARRAFWASALSLFVVVSVIGILLFSYGHLFVGSAKSFYDRPTPKRYTLSLDDLGMPEGQWLSGFPSYASFEVPLPRDADVVNATLSLRLKTDVSENAIVALRIAANDRRIEDIVLEPGRKTLRIKFPFDRITKEQEKLRVSLSLSGDLGETICHDDHATGAVVQVLPETKVRVNLANPISTVRDVVALLPERVAIALPTSPDNKDWVEFASNLAVRMQHLGYDIVILPLNKLTDTLELVEHRGLILLGDLARLKEKGFNTYENYDLAHTQASEVAEQPEGSGIPSIVVGYSGNDRVLGITSPTPEAIAQLLTTPILSVAARNVVDPAIVSTKRFVEGEVDLSNSGLTYAEEQAKRRGGTMDYSLMFSAKSGKAKNSRVVSMKGPREKEVSLTSLGVDVAVQQVRERRSWPVKYSLADMPGGRIPSMLRVALRMPEGPRDYINMVHVELNGNLISSSRVISPGVTSVGVHLPHDIQRLRNKLNISLQRYRDLGGCQISAGKFPVQILPESALVLGGKSSTMIRGFADLPKVFSEGIEVRVPERIVGAEAPAALNALLPVLTEFMPFNVSPHFTWVAHESNDVPRRPYIAFQHVPPRTRAAISLLDDSLVVKTPAGVTQKVRSIDKVISVEHVTSQYVVNKDKDLYEYAEGVVVLHSSNLPEHVQADFGWEQALIIPDQSDTVELEQGYLKWHHHGRLNSQSYYRLTPK